MYSTYNTHSEVYTQHICTIEYCAYIYTHCHCIYVCIYYTQHTAHTCTHSVTIRLYTTYNIYNTYVHFIQYTPQLQHTRTLVSRAYGCSLSRMHYRYYLYHRPYRVYACTYLCTRTH